MKKILIPILLFASAATVSAQSNDITELSLFRGGDLNVNFQLGMNFNGFGPGTSMMGGITSSRVKSGAGSLITNPAELAFNRKASLIIDGQPGVGIRSGSIFSTNLLPDINAEIETATDDVLSDTTAFLKTPDAYIRFTEMRDLNAGFATRLGAIALALPVTEKLTMAFSVSQPIDLRFGLNSSGLTTKIAQEQGTKDVSLRFDVLMNIGMLGDFNLTMNQVNAGFGYLLWQNRFDHELSIGFSASRYEVENRRFLDTDLSGVVVIGGADERFFNNLADPNLDTARGESNDFYLRTAGTFRDKAWGFRTGLLYKRGWLNASLAYNQMPAFELSDANAYGAASLPVFLVGDDPFSGLEVILDTLQPSKPNLTTIRDVSKFTKNISWQMPSSITAGFDIAMAAHTLSLNYSYYLDDFKITVGEDTYGRKAPQGVGLGMDFRGTDRFATWHQLYIFPLRLLFFDVDGILFQAFRKRTGYTDPHYRFGFRAMLGSGFSEGSTNESIATVFDLPLTPIGFSMGREYTLWNDVRVGVTTFAWPDLMFRLSLAYQF